MMEIFTKETGKMIRQMDTESIDKKMGLFLKAIGKMINNMVKELKFGVILLSMKEIILMVKNKDMEFLPLTMEVIMKGSSTITSSITKELISGSMEKFTKVIG